MFVLLENPENGEDSSFLEVRCPCGANEISLMLIFPRRHVLRDLKPYNCTYGGCPEECRMFRRRRDWFQHELDVHRTYWECPRCLELLSNEDDFKSHMLDLHQSNLTQEQMESLTRGLAKQQDQRHETSCIHCGENYQVNEALRRHLGGEMEEIALFVTPRPHDSLSVMPQPHDFWDGSDGSSATDTSESTAELLEQGQLTEELEIEAMANAARSLSTISKEAQSADCLSSETPKQKSTDSDTPQLEVNGALDAIKPNRSPLSDVANEEKGNILTNAALEIYFPDSESNLWIPERISDTNDPSVDATCETLHLSLDMEGPETPSSDDIACTAFASYVDDAFLRLRTDSLNPHVLKVDTSPYLKGGRNTSFVRVQGPHGNEDPPANSPREDPPLSPISRISPPAASLSC